jgi:hypothetical protein
MTREFSVSIEDIWSDSMDETVTENNLGIFPYLATRDIHELGDAFFFEEISCSHGNDTDEFHKIIFFFFEQFLNHY